MALTHFRFRADFFNTPPPTHPPEKVICFNTSCWHLVLSNFIFRQLRMNSAMLSVLSYTPLFIPSPLQYLKWFQIIWAFHLKAGWAGCMFLKYDSFVSYLVWCRAAEREREYVCVCVRERERLVWCKGCETLGRSCYVCWADGHTLFFYSFIFIPFIHFKKKKNLSYTVPKLDFGLTAGVVQSKNCINCCLRHVF